MIEMADVLGEHFEQMALAQDDDVIETRCPGACGRDAFERYTTAAERPFARLQTPSVFGGTTFAFAFFVVFHWFTRNARRLVAAGITSGGQPQGRRRPWPPVATRRAD